MPGATPPAPAGIPSEAVNLKSWQFAFNRLDDLPEILVQGHERADLAFLFATKISRTYAIEPTAFEEYVRVFSTPGVARAGFAWYRANFSAEGLAQAKMRAAKRLTMPVLALGASDGVGDALRAAVATIGDRVRGGAIREARGRFLPSECPPSSSTPSSPSGVRRAEARGRRGARLIHHASSAKSGHARCPTIFATADLMAINTD